jgi:hypothetical protein
MPVAAIVATATVIAGTILQGPTFLASVLAKFGFGTGATTIPTLPPVGAPGAAATGAAAEEAFVAAGGKTGGSLLSRILGKMGGAMIFTSQDIASMDIRAEAYSASKQKGTPYEEEYARISKETGFNKQWWITESPVEWLKQQFTNYALGTAGQALGVWPEWMKPSAKEPGAGYLLGYKYSGGTEEQQAAGVPLTTVGGGGVQNNITFIVYGDLLGAAAERIIGKQDDLARKGLYGATGGPI